MTTRSTVLIVEDDQGCSDVMTEVLQDLGHDVVVSRRAKEVPPLVALYEPALVVVDLMLPDGSGADVLRQLRQDARTSELPVLVCTAALFELRELQFAAADAHTLVVTKPFHIETLADAASSLLR